MDGAVGVADAARRDVRAVAKGARMPPPADRSEAEPLARTTVRLPRPLLKRARIRCVTDELTLQSLVASALETELDRRDQAEQRQLRRITSPATIDK
jgi:hypothetical protein